MVNRQNLSVITLTINPAIDVHISLDTLRPCSDNLGKITRRDLGGKGVNVSRALASLGIESACLIAVGRENGLDFAGGLIKQGLNVNYCLVDGAVRENINLHASSGDTVISTTGPILNTNDIAQLEELLFASLTKTSILVFSGRIAEGTDKNAVINMLLRAKDLGASLILDSRSLNASDISILAPLMIKPNLDEAELLLGHAIEDATLAALELNRLRAEYVLLTLGEDGLVISNGNEVVQASALPVNVISTVGAGDSTVASFINSYIHGHTLEETAVHAVATSAAACMAEGTLPPDPCQIKLNLEQIKTLPRSEKCKQLFAK